MRCSELMNESIELMNLWDSSLLRACLILRHRRHHAEEAKPTLRGNLITHNTNSNFFDFDHERRRSPTICSMSISIISDVPEYLDVFTK